MGKTSIEWTDHSWPLVNGCRRASPGCGGASGVGGCYAERLASTRLRQTPKYKGLAVYKEGKGPQWTGVTRLWEKDLLMPLRLRKTQKIFVADMGDLFYEGVADEVIDRVFGIMLACVVLKTWNKRMMPAHIFQVLTKRADRMRAYLSTPPSTLLERWARAVSGDLLVDDGDSYFWELVRANTAHAWGPDGAAPQGDPYAPWQHVKDLFPLPNVWLGVSVEDQKYADERIPELLQTPAAIRFISYEPALGPIDLRQIKDGSWYDREGADLYDALDGTAYWANGDHGMGGGPHLDWVIAGGESGVGARPCDLAWLRRVVRDCRRHRCPCFVKQLGRGRRIKGGGYSHDDSSTKTTVHVKHSKGADWAEWPSDLRVREFPRAGRLTSATTTAAGAWLLQHEAQQKFDESALVAPPRRAYAWNRKAASKA